MRIKKTVRALNWKKVEAIRTIRFLILRQFYKSGKVFVTKEQLRKCKKIIIFMGSNGFGDAIVITGLIKVLKERGFHVTVLAKERLVALFRELQSIDATFTLKDKKKLSIASLEKAIDNGPYDLLVNFSQRAFLLDNLLSLNLYKIFKPRYLVGFDDIFDIFDIAVKYEEKNEHFSKRLEAFLAAIGIYDYKMKYNIDIPQRYAEETEAFLKEFEGEKIVCLNPFASQKNRDFSLKQITEIGNYLSNKENVRMIIIGEPYQLSRLENIILPKCAIINKLKNFFNAAYIVKRAELIISTDTAIVHLANAYDKKLICLYNNRILGRGRSCNLVWGPNYEGAIQLFTKEKRGTFEGDDVSNFDVSEINYYVDKIL